MRVAVTGLGAKTPAGADAGSAYATTLAGRCLARRLDGYSASGETVLACLVPDDATEGYFNRRELNGMDRTAVLGVSAALDAFADSGLEPDGRLDRWAIAVGVGGTGEAATAENITRSFLADGTGVTVFTAGLLMPNATAARIALRLGVTGPALTYATACTSGATAIGEGLRAIRGGYADVVIAGGVDAGLAPLVVEGFLRVGAVSRRIDDPAASSRPFDADRDGFVMGEGGAFLVLERWDHATDRGARIYAELAGYGSNSDAFHIVAPRPDGSVAAACMSAALADAGIGPADIGHVNAHGTSTVRNDDAETEAILRCFGADAPPVTATKGVTGHMIGGAGAFEAVVTVLSVAGGLVPPVANHVRQSGDAKLDIVAGEPRPLSPAAALSTSFAFGGHNAALVFRPV